MKTKISMVLFFVLTATVALLTFSLNTENGIAAYDNDGMVLIHTNSCPVVYVPTIWDNSELCGTSNNFCEDNDSYETAHPIDPGVTYYAFPEDNHDYYSFNLRKQGTVTIRVTDYYSTGQVQLRDMDGDLIDYDFSNPNGEMELVKAIDAGSYFIRVSTTPETFSRTLYSLVLDLPHITPEPTPILVCTPTIAPTATSTVGTEPPLPSDYSMFDDFNGIGPLSEEKWYIENEPDESCTGIQLDGFLNTRCQTDTESAYIYYDFLPENINLSRAGAAIAAKAITPHERGHVELNLVLSNQTQTENIRKYALTIYYNELAIVEHYPQNDTQRNLVVIQPFDGTKVHILQIEYVPLSQSVIFYVDNQEIVLDEHPDIPTGSRARRWEILQYLESAQTPINWESKVYWAALRPE